MRSFAIFARLGVGLTLMVCWGLVDSPLAGVVYILALTALSALRYRLEPYKWLIAAEAAICIGYAFLWLPALLGLWLPAIGLLENKWDAEEKEILQKAIEDRGERLKLQSAIDAIALETKNAARLAEMAERSRIAQDIHDSVGHEISGASLALQTAIKLYEKNDERARGLFDQSAKRLETASEHLREAVHNLKPSKVIGVETLHDLCNDFSFCEARFESSGDLSHISHWNLLAANLKETLTNISRHSNATLASVKLDANTDYVRLCVTDNGKIIKAPKMGLGLSGMRERVRSAGGTLTVSTENGFSVVTILPRQ